MNSQNKLVLITGGSSGIGLSLARLYVQKGANVWALARSADKLKDALRLLKQNAVRPDQNIGVIQADVSKEEDIKSALKEFIDQQGTPDIVINSAGVVHPGRFETLESEKFRWMLNVNFLGTVYVLQAIIPQMVKRGSGTIINIGSGASFLGIYGYSAYSGSKYALRGFSDVLRAEMKPFGIQVSIVFPPDTETPQLDYELKYKPAITKEITGIVKPLSPDLVANRIIKGVERGKYVIIPDFQTTMLYRLNNILGNFSYQVMDYLVSSAIRKHGLDKSKDQREHSDLGNN